VQGDGCDEKEQSEGRKAFVHVEQDVALPPQKKEHHKGHYEDVLLFAFH
jgi:hypothetical protein